MQDGFIAQATKTGMAMYEFDALANDDIAEDWKEGEDGGKGCLAVDDQKGYVVDFEAICQVAHTCSSGIGMSYDNDLVSAIDEFLSSSAMYR